MSFWALAFLIPWLTLWVGVGIWWYFKRRVHADTLTAWLEERIDRGDLDK